MTIAFCSCLAVLAMGAATAAACEGQQGGCQQAPSVTTTSPGSVSSNSAYVYGDVDAHGCESTTYVFEYRQSGGLWKKGGTYGVFGSGSQLVSDYLTSLLPATTYEYKLTASNFEGTSAGSTKSFTTPPEGGSQKPPTVANEAATAITASGATLNASVNPNGAATTYNFEYGLKEGELKKTTTTVSDLTGSSSQKVKAEVTLEPETKYYFRITATNSGGTSTGTPILNFTTSAALWKIKATPNPAEPDFSSLQDISCMPSTSACTAVGTSTTAAVDSPLAFRWNGSSWTEQVPAKKTGAVETRIFGVDCPSETRCLAVGSYEASGGQPTIMSAIWNENKWGNQTTPNPSEATSSEFTAIGCNNTAECKAVGSATIGGVKTAIAEKWNSPTWTAQSLPIPEGAKSSQLDGVDCLWSNFCAAVGRYTTSGGSIKSLAIFWNGTEWKLQTLTDPEGAVQSGLRDISCTPSPSRCTAVGDWKNGAGEEATMAYRFNGTTWTLQSMPKPPGSIGSLYHEVSCATETACAAVGNWRSKADGWFRTLAASWDGSSWSIQSTQNPAGALISNLAGVSCQSTSCFAVGLSLSGTGEITTLGEFRE
ncbi:MAG TPA: fibronectin type III domain-containing protein [Solirubrobacterales bacterium]|nr:fibronectin type III domain-containing protein [Solirubrobacterales bacterium]